MMETEQSLPKPANTMPGCRNQEQSKSTTTDKKRLCEKLIEMLLPACALHHQQAPCMNMVSGPRGSLGEWRCGVRRKPDVYKCRACMCGLSLAEPPVLSIGRVQLLTCSPASLHVMRKRYQDDAHESLPPLQFVVSVQTNLAACPVTCCDGS